MDIFLYAIIFIIGSFFGSFFTLAVYRIPRKEDILIKHSYCPNCNHKLGFFDLFPIFSYLILKGKCRYCETKIRPRYLLLEMLSGVTFLILAITMKLDVNNINNIIYIAFTLFYVSILFIIAGIDKENINIQKNVVAVGYIIETIYIIYQCTLGNINVYQYVIYLIFLILIILLSNLSLKIKAEEKYYITILYLLLYMLIYSGSKITTITIIMTLLITAIYTFLTKKGNRENIAVGFYLSVSNILIIIISNIIMNFVI